METANSFSFIARLKRHLTGGDVRTAKALRNILLSFVYKAINVAAGLLLVRFAIEYIDPTRYGVWLTLSSIILWFNFFDVGLGHGMRNKLAEAVAKGREDLGARYVSTAYGVLAIVSASFFAVFYVANHFLDWNQLLNTKRVPGDELSSLALLVFGSFSFRLVFRLINSVSFALQSPSIRDAIESATRVINLTMLIVLLYSTESSMLYLGLVYSISPVLVMMIFSLWLYAGPYRSYAPRPANFDASLTGSIMGLGSRFFILQVSSVILFTTDNVIIAQLFSPADVTPYHIAHRYFGVAAMGFAIIVSPLWSATTDAYVKGDFEWIRTTVKRLITVWMVFGLGIIGMLVVSEGVYTLWIGDMVAVPFALSCLWAVYTMQQSVHGIFVRFVNGVGKIRIQMIHSVVSAVINIPLSIFLARNLNLGVAGVIAATTLTQISGLCFMIVQYNKLIKRKAYGIWNR